MGSLYKRGGTWWIKYHHRGKPVRESSRSDKKMIAKKLLDLREGEIAHGRLPTYIFDRVTFDDLAADYLADYRANRKKTCCKAERLVRLHLQPFFTGKKVTDLTSVLINEYIITRLTSGAANASVNRELSALKRMLNIGAQQTPPKVDRVPHIAMLNENNTRKGFFEYEEFQRLTAVLATHWKRPVIFAYRTGWRFSEIANLTWDRVDTKFWIVRLEAGETKNSEGRTIYLDQELQALIKDALKVRRLGCPYVFHRDGEQLKHSKHWWETACTKTKLEGKLFHDLRRTAIRNMIRSGIPERVAMMISGHKTRSVFDRYNIVSEDDLRSAAQRQSEYLKGLT